MLYDLRYQVLRKALVDARVSAGLTQLAMAQRLQRAQSYVSKVETGGRYLDVMDFLAWCEVAQISPGHVLEQVRASDPSPWLQQTGEN
ncbi:MAG: helix-turn-helix transcriptional regulator [Candidatus Saccharibacteria bacterium]|nr:helix-turn-helix transcriptional regulator [Rhodoferax sp.]